MKFGFGHLPNSVSSTSKDRNNSLSLFIYSLLFLLSICSESNYLDTEGKTQSSFMEEINK